MLALAVIPDVAIGVLALAIVALVKVVWSIASRLSRLEGELGVGSDRKGE